MGAASDEDEAAIGGASEEEAAIGGASEEDAAIGGASDDDTGATELDEDTATGVTGVGVPRLKIQMRPMMTITATMIMIQVLRFMGLTLCLR